MFSFDESTEISARFYRKVFRKDLFTKISFRKNVHADFYGYSDVNFVVSVFDPNIHLPLIDRSIDTVHLLSINNVHPASINTFHRDTVH